MGRYRLAADRMPRLKATKSLSFAVLIVWAFVSLIPILWMFVTSFQQPSMAISLPPKIVLSELTFENFERLFQANSLARWSINSLLVASVTTALYVLISSMAGYAFSKKEFFGKKVIFWFYVSTMLVPGFVTLVTAYTVVVDLGWVDKYWALIIPEVASPFGAFLMKQFIQNLPDELFDAARIDGCGEWSIFWKIVVPLAVPAMAVLAVFHFGYIWNSFIWPLTVTSTDLMRTLPVGLASLQRVRATNFSLLMAGAAYAALPMIIIFLIGQKYFLKGVTMGAVKG